MRLNDRSSTSLRPLSITRHFLKHAEGSVLIQCGETKVVITATITPGVPPFLKGSGNGWITAEYGMLPRSTQERMPREAARGKQTGRTQEIQRLIGRCLRASVDLSAIGEQTIQIDCDVIQADGGTRTASITGGCIALYDALMNLRQKQNLVINPFRFWVAAISVGIKEKQVLLDLDYSEDSTADIDMNVVMTEQGEFIELQGAAEKNTFTQTQLLEMLASAKQGIYTLIEKQKTSVAL